MGIWYTAKNYINISVQGARPKDRNIFPPFVNEIDYMYADRERIISSIISVSVCEWALVVFATALKVGGMPLFQINVICILYTIFNVCVFLYTMFSERSKSNFYWQWNSEMIAQGVATSYYIKKEARPTVKINNINKVSFVKKYKRQIVLYEKQIALYDCELKEVYKKYNQSTMDVELLTNLLASSRENNLNSPS